MKKRNGFTVAELIIVLGIVGCITALMIPTATKVKPDNNKVRYLKAYDAILSAIHDMARSSRIYPYTYDFVSEGISYTADLSSIPLYNTEKNTSTKYNYKGESKFCRILALELDAVSNGCGEMLLTDNNISWNNPSFVTSNGISWIVGPVVKTQIPPVKNSGNKFVGQFENVIYIKLEPDGNECIYSDECKNSNVFKFAVTADGAVYPADSKGAYYVKTRTMLIKKNEVYNAFKTASNKFIVPVSGSCAVGYVWDNTTNSCVAANNSQSECESKGGHYYNGTCYICNEDEYWTGTECKTDYTKDKNECEARGGHWGSDNTCHICEQGQYWNGSDCTTDSKPSGGKSEAESACQRAGGTWTGTTCNCGQGNYWTGSECKSTDNSNETYNKGTGDGESGQSLEDLTSTGGGGAGGDWYGLRK